MTIDPQASDTGNLGVSLANLAEVMLPCLDAAQVTSIAELGAYAGDLTDLLLEWAATAGARVVAIDPEPQRELVALDKRRPDLELIRDTSLNALARIETPDAVVLDGDHNYYTVSEELRLIAERGGPLPLLLFHDVAWPHGRRDDYFDPELVPAEHRHPTAHNASIFPGEPETREGGVPYHWPAAREGGPRNGVLTAVEDFVAAHDGLRVAVVPAFFGFGVVWRDDAPWADAVAETLAPWDGNPLLERLEANRVFHLAGAHGLKVQASIVREREERRDELLRRVLESRAFSVAERISRLRQRGEPAISKDEVRRALES